MDLSIVIPVFNEEASVKPMYEAVIKNVDPLNLKYEIIFVDDGSKDNTFINAQKIALSDSNVIVVKLKRNYGQTAGLHAGFKAAKGKIIITMDGDLQNDPSDIGTMVSKVNEGYDIVLGWRHDRKDFLISRKIPSKIANWLISKVTGVPVKDNGCAIRAYRGEVVKGFPMYSEMHRLMPVITALSGAKFAQIKVKHHPRRFGHSKYGLSRIYKVLIDMAALKIIFSFFHLPLYGFGLLAIIPALFAVIFMTIGISNLLLTTDYSLVVFMGSSLLLASLSLFLIFLGLISEMVYKTGDIKIERLLKSRVMRLNKKNKFNPSHQRAMTGGDTQ